jgi:hypothetical protein
MEGIALILLVIFGYSIAQSAMRSADKRRADTVRLLEEALRNPQVDRQTVDNLARQLSGTPAGQPTRAAGLGFAGPAVVAIGWFGLFLGVVCLICSNFAVVDGVAEELVMGGWVVILFSFACLTYPFAVREARARVARN